nr:flavodoxin domain-containing protein [uncultured Mucilaginibacter sp.]
MNGIIIYQGRYGATSQYAGWLAQALKLPMIGTEITPPEALAKYDVIILGSSIYVGQLVINKWLKQNGTLLSKKKLFLFVVSGSTTNNQLLQQQVIKSNLDPVLSKLVEVYFVPGRCNISGLSWTDRILLKIGAWFEKDPMNKEAMQNGFDNMDRKALDPLIAAVGADE